jgi:outer membrane protein
LTKLSQLFRSSGRGVSVASGLSIVCFGWSVQAADLLDVYRLAIRNDPTVEVARYTLKAAQEKYPQALAGLLPSVSASGSNNVTRAQNQFGNAATMGRNVRAWNWSLQLTQPLIRLQNYYAYDEAQWMVEQARAQYDLAEHDLILRVVQAYFGVLSSQEGIKVGESELSAAEEQLSLSTRSFEKGVAAITDVNDSQARVDLARSHLVAARSELDAKDAELSKIVDDVPPQLAPLNSAVLLPLPQPNDSKAWIEQSRENNPAVHAAQFGLLVAEARVGKSRAEYAPTLDMVASYGENYSSGSIAFPTDFASQGQTVQAGVQFSVPLFTGGSTNSHVAESIANKHTAGANLEAALRQAGTDARLAFFGVTNGVSQIAALESAVKSSQSAVNGSRAGYKVGIYNNINVLDAEKQLYTAKRDWVKARYETLFQALKLKAVAGLLGKDELINVNTLLEHQAE